MKLLEPTIALLCMAVVVTCSDEKPLVASGNQGGHC